jgi:hypothetical protein
MPKYRKIGGFVRLFRFSIDRDSNPDDDVPIVKGKEATIMEEMEQIKSGGIPKNQREAMIHDLILVVKSAMAKVNSRDQMWCDIISATEKQIRRVVEQNTK